MVLSEKYNLIVVLGPTATGKTRFAALLANTINAEIVSADSRQVYKKMNLGTGKDYEDYQVDNHLIPSHLIDIHNPGYKYNVFEFQHDFFNKYKEITNRDRTVILCGGTGMYIESVTKGYKLVSVPVNQALRDSLDGKSLDELAVILSKYKTLHNQSDTDTIKRAVRAIELGEFYAENPDANETLPPISPVYIGINFDREIRRQRITERLKKRLNSGLIQEVEELIESGIPAENLIYYGLEYKYITLYLTGALSYSEMESQLNTAIHQFAKRQMTWFRKMERQGVKINWLDGFLSDDEKIKEALKFIS
jgi:tRNA dimethylallyltransferase